VKPAKVEQLDILLEDNHQDTVIQGAPLTFPDFPVVHWLYQTKFVTKRLIISQENSYIDVYLK
jgi:hypothetical protein